MIPRTSGHMASVGNTLAQGGLLLFQCRNHQFQRIGALIRCLPGAGEHIDRLVEALAVQQIAQLHGGDSNPLQSDGVKSITAPYAKGAEYSE